MDTLYQRFFRANQNQANRIFYREISYVLKIGSLNVHISAVLRSAGVAGCNKKMVAFWALRNFPGEGAFPSARSEEQDIHAANVKYNVQMCEYADVQMKPYNISTLQHSNLFLHHVKKIG